MRFQKNAFSLSRGLLFRIFTWDNNFHLSPSLLCPVQTDENIHVANNSQYCWMLHVGSVRTALCTLLSVVGSCCPKFETVQTFSYVKTDATTPNDVVGRCYVCLQVVWDILLSKGNREQQGKFNFYDDFSSAIVEILVQFCYSKFCKLVYEFIILNNNLRQGQRSEEH